MTSSWSFILELNKTNYNCTIPNLIAAVSFVSGEPYTLNICTHSFKTSLLHKKISVSVSQEYSLHITDKPVLPNLKVWQKTVFEIFHTKRKNMWRNKCMIKSHTKAELKGKKVPIYICRHAILYRSLSYAWHFMRKAQIFLYQQYKV